MKVRLYKSDCLFPNIFAKGDRPMGRKEQEDYRKNTSLGHVDHHLSIAGAPEDVKQRLLSRVDKEVRKRIAKGCHDGDISGLPEMLEQEGYDSGAARSTVLGIFAHHWKNKPKG